MLSQRCTILAGKVVIDPGFTRTMHWQALPPEERMMPSDLNVNQQVPINEVSAVQ